MSPLCSHGPVNKLWCHVPFLPTACLLQPRDRTPCQGRLGAPKTCTVLPQQHPMLNPDRPTERLPFCRLPPAPSSCVYLRAVPDHLCLGERLISSATPTEKFMSKICSSDAKRRTINDWEEVKICFQTRQNPPPLLPWAKPHCHRCARFLQVLERENVQQKVGQKHEGCLLTCFSACLWGLGFLSWYSLRRIPRSPPSCTHRVLFLSLFFLSVQKGNSFVFSVSQEGFFFAPISTETLL